MIGMPRIIKYGMYDAEGVRKQNENLNKAVEVLVDIIINEEFEITARKAWAASILEEITGKPLESFK